MFRRAMDFISGCFDLGWIAGCKVYILAGLSSLDSHILGMSLILILIHTPD